MHPTHWLISTQVHPLASIRAWAAILRGGCLQAPGDVLYVPRGWTHATLNVGEALAVGAQAQWPAADRLRRARAVLACVEINQCVGCTRVDGVEDDAMIQHERAVNFDFHTGPGARARRRPRAALGGRRRGRCGNQPVS